jgi:hypothetical protein
MIISHECGLWALSCVLGKEVMYRLYAVCTAHHKLAMSLPQRCDLEMRCATNLPSLTACKRVMKR